MTWTAMRAMTAFLTARLDEDEALLSSSQTYVVVWSKSPLLAYGNPEAKNLKVQLEFGPDAVVYSDGMDHRLRDALLRQVEAHRAVLASLREHEVCLARGYADITRGGQLTLMDVVRDLAAVYSDHPDYRQEWRP